MVSKEDGGAESYRKLLQTMGGEKGYKHKTRVIPQGHSPTDRL